MSQQVILRDDMQSTWLLFADPIHVIQARSIHDVLPALQRVEHLVTSQGLYAAGFIAYEAAPAFDSALRVRPADGMPLVWFGIYASPRIVVPPQGSAATYHVGEWQPTVAREEYNTVIAQIKEYIARGDTYQVNYTLRLRAPFSGDPYAFWANLVKAQGARYAAYVDIGRYVVCSASPELFFSLQGSRLVSRPMKGTAPRGVRLEDDLRLRNRLYHSEKERAENVMIVDMVRNDMGRIAVTGSVRVPALFEVERYPTVWQMTSTVEARTHAPVPDILRALFPCASITGAPKVRTMEIIAKLESTPRGVYTGAIGFIAPSRRAQFNVAIRTVVIDRESGTAEYGVGGGIVWDSLPEQEYREYHTKARVLTTSWPDFQLLESLLWEPGRGYFLLDPHLKRLAASAEYFGFPFDRALVQELLRAAVLEVPAVPHKVRLLLSAQGDLHVEARPLSSSQNARPWRVALAPQPVVPDSPFLYHKTTYRDVYEAARKARPRHDDVLLWNTRGELTESTIANIAVRLGGVWFTPPVSSGLLPGTFREWLLRQGHIQERVIYLEDLRRAEGLALINSVRRWIPATLTEEVEHNTSDNDPAQGTGDELRWSMFPPPETGPGNNG